MLPYLWTFAFKITDNVFVWFQVGVLGLCRHRVAPGLNATRLGGVLSPGRGTGSHPTIGRAVVVDVVISWRGHHPRGTSWPACAQNTLLTTQQSPHNSATCESCTTRKPCHLVAGDAICNQQTALLLHRHRCVECNVGTKQDTHLVGREGPFHKQDRIGNGREKSKTRMRSRYTILTTIVVL